MFFRSERLFLRPGWPEDWSDLFARIANEQTVRNLAGAPGPYGNGAGAAASASTGAGDDVAALGQDRRYPVLLITLPQQLGGSELIGFIGLHQRPEAPAAEPELGYWIARHRWGQGYATEAGRAVLAIAGTLGHRRITAGHFMDNPASGRVLEKLGFRATGRAEPRFSVLRGERAWAQVHVRELAGASGGDGEGGGESGRRDKAPMPRAA